MPGSMREQQKEILRTPAHACPLHQGSIRGTGGCHLGGSAQFSEQRREQEQDKPSQTGSKAPALLCTLGPDLATQPFNPTTLNPQSLSSDSQRVTNAHASLTWPTGSSPL